MDDLQGDGHLEQPLFVKMLLLRSSWGKMTGHQSGEPGVASSSPTLVKMQFSFFLISGTILDKESHDNNSVSFDFASEESG